jgi:hypothetical protein
MRTIGHAFNAACTELHDTGAARRSSRGHDQWIIAAQKVNVMGGYGMLP